MRRSALYLALALPPLLLAAACGGGTTASTGEPDPEAIVVIGSQNEPTSLDNNVGGSSGLSEVLLRNVYEGLVALDDEGEIVPALAESWDISEDGRDYTFHLATDVTFHDGSEFDATDAVWSIERTIAPDSVNPKKQSLAGITSVTAPDENTVEISLADRSNEFLFGLTTSAGLIFPEDATDVAEQAVGTGPFTLDEWKRGDSITLSRYAEYWGEPAASAGVVFRYFDDATAMSNALQGGQVDLLASVPSPELLAAFEGNPQYQVTEGASNTKTLLAFNNEREPLTDPRVRRGLRAAIDHQAVLDAVWDGYGELIGSGIPPTDPWYEDLTANIEHDPEQARELLADAGFEDGLTLSLDVPSEDKLLTVAQLVQDQLAAVDVTVELNTIESATWYDKVFTQVDYDLTIQNHVNPHDVFWYANPDFYWRYDDPQVQEWVAQADVAETEQERVELLRQVGERISEEAASDWLFLNPLVRVARQGIEGYPQTALADSLYLPEITKAG
ncbi:ABC transporter substrate-binding protein [Actinoalloteichus hymeniacidonis]|uniref:ABC-type dipeptide transport system, periplasmic component n=1 Tax=Actinoalloteichus hymeniacidonis TaxID=340345 RepID=A0AAC9HSD1_9PSEU|nr:ABC transporter substrate-binding protein [Actinoalloteichus hymeniacidonis]AOS64684.1 ABC-type dipeptide transport system, periplasmic component [Actinoalloteichus hymeniacidonis]MBB5907241.1 peptide/nickel transport system substrate-binding protein [Actinoalloteichus hymeniacidonis]